MEGLESQRVKLNRRNDITAIRSVTSPAELQRTTGAMFADGDDCARMFKKCFEEETRVRVVAGRNVVCEEGGTDEEK